MKKFKILIRKYTTKFYSKTLLEQYPKAKRAIENFQLGNELSEKNQFLKSRVLLDDACQELSKELPENHQILGLCYNNLAETMRKLSPTILKEKNFHYKNIKELYEMVVKIWTCNENKNSPDVLSCLGTLYNNYGTYYFENVNDYEKALEKFNLAYEVRLNTLINSSFEQKVNNGSLLAITCNNIGLTQTYLKNYEEAQKFFQEAIEHSKFFNTRIHINALNNIGFCKSKQSEKDVNEINEIKINAYELTKKVNFDDSGLEVATAISNYAVLKYETKEYEESEKLFKQSLNIFETKLPNEKLNIALVSANLSGLLKVYKPDEKDEISYYFNKAKNISLDNFSTGPLTSLIKKINF
jgi:tetratricopeptide (TPR) repeat protein